MRRVAVLVLITICVAGTVAAQSPGPRAWQQRLHLEVPMAVPAVTVAAANPFAVVIDQGPRLVNSNPPKGLDAHGEAVVAAYVDARGDCLGAVPLELPFPGMTSAVLTEFTGSRFDAARVGKQEVPSWAVVQIRVETKIKRAEIIAEDFILPDATTPPEPELPVIPRPSGQLMNLPFSPASSLSELAIPKRVRLRVSGREAEVTVRALVHITAAGRCDRYVPLEVDSGLDMWLANYLASWSLHPAQRGGEPADSWMVYTARVRFKLGSLSSASFGIVRDRAYDPMEGGEGS
jgi:hypothetical protein